MDRDAARDDERDAAPVTALLLAYYRALETGAPLAPFYATDAAAGDLGPVVKFGSGKGEAFRGRRPSRPRSSGWAPRSAPTGSNRAP